MLRRAGGMKFVAEGPIHARRIHAGTPPPGRVPHHARIILSGTDADGFNFAEETETLSVSKQGLSARTSYNLAIGQELSIRTKDRNRVAQFQIVWAGNPETPSHGRVGLEWV